MKVVCILVTYNPDMEKLSETLSSIENQVDKILIINNSTQFLILGEKDNIEIIELGKNYGIAYAQNVGIRKAILLEPDFVLISDQDTVYPDNYVDGFIPYVKESLAHIYCPVFYDNIKNTYSPIMIEKFKSISFIDTPTYVEHAIASGTLIDISIFEKVGLMDERLFIDYVDFEWCWRATSMGYKIVTIPEVIINHQLGDGVKKVLFKNVTLRSNMRYYYIIRNGFYLAAHCKYLSKSEKHKLYQRSMSFFIGVILLKHDWNTIKLCLRALRNGLKGKLGSNF